MRIGLAVLLAIAAATTGPAPAQTPFARVTLETDSPVIVGQPVAVRVEALVPEFFTTAPVWPDMVVPDALTIFQPTGGSNFTESIDGQTWAGQSRRYVIFPQKPGKYETGRLEIVVKFFADRRMVTAGAVPAPVSFEAVLPPEARHLSYFIATRELELSQSFDIEPDTLRVGGAFRREITAELVDGMGMVVPPFPIPEIPGVAIYRDPPVVDETRGERGATIVGTRIERITYVAEREGAFEIPAVKLEWWDLGAGRLRLEKLDPFTVTVLPAIETAALPLPEERSGTDPEIGLADRVSPRAAVRWLTIAVIAGIAIVRARRLFLRVQPRIRDRIEERRRVRANSEAAFFGEFREAARSGDARATWRTLTSWLDRVHTGRGAARVRDFAEATGDPELVRQVQALDLQLFGAGPAESPWSAEGLVRAVSRWRHRGSPAPPREEALELNPGRVLR